MDITYLAYTTNSEGRPVPTVEARKYSTASLNGFEHQNKLSPNNNNNNHQINFRRVVSPLVTVLLFFAVDIRPLETDNKKKRTCFVSKILPALHLLLYVITCAFFYFSWKTDNDTSSSLKIFSANLAKGLCISAFFITHIFFFLRRRRISLLLDNISTTLVPTSADDAEGVVKDLLSIRWVVLSLVPLPFIILVLVYIFYNVAGIIQDSIFAFNVRNATIDADIDGIFMEYTYVLFMSFFAIIFCFFIYAVGLFCMIIRTLTIVVRSLKCPGIASGSVSVALADVATFLKLHEVVCKLVVETDGSFKEVACVWCTIEMTCAVLFGRSANINFKDTPEFDFVLAFSVIILLFVYKVLTTATVNDSVVTSLKEISYVDENTLQDLSPRSAALATKIKLYIQHVMVSSPTITGWGLFTIDKAVVLSAAGSILTYILVLYDK